MAALVTLAGACGSDNNQVTLATSPNPVLSAITVTLGATTVPAGQTTTATAAGVDQNGAPFAVNGITWSSSNTSVATVSSTGLVTGVGPGTAQITAASGGKTGSATVTVSAASASSVATVTVSPTNVMLVVGATQTMTAVTRDANGAILSGRPIAWSSSDPTKATVTPTGLVQAISPGTATIVATSEGKSGSAAVTVASTQPAPACTPSSGLKLNLGEVHALNASEVASLCLGGLSTGSEYVLIPFNNSSIASLTTQIELASMNTIAVTTSPALIPGTAGRLSIDRAVAAGRVVESKFRANERRDIGSLSARGRVRKQITGVPTNPAVGSTVQLNANLNGNTCSDPKILHSARVVAVSQHAIIFLDAQSPAGGYTDAELAAFGAAFDALSFPIDTTNFGANTDIDKNGRVGIFFTPGINQIPGPVGGVIGGLFAARDLFPATIAGCPASNEGEMFYLPVPDPNHTINSSYGSKSQLSSLVQPTLAHEFQHLINAGRRIYVNDATELEQVWLNEGLSHIAEELLYYQQSGNAPLQNIDLPRITANQAQVDAFNNDQSSNFGRLSTYLAAPSRNSPYGLIDGLEMRGAIWQLLRYSADHKGGDQRATWFALANSTTNGQANFNAVFGDIVTNTRNWAVAQFIDDLGFAVPAQYTNPSWNFRSVFSGVGAKRFPLATNALLPGASVQLTVVGGGAAYVRFGVSAGVAANVAATSQGQAVPPNVDFILVRTR